MTARGWIGAAALAALAAAAVAPAPVGATGLPSFTRAEALDLARVDVPAGVGLILHADFPAEAPLVVGDVAYHSVTIDLTPHGSVITRNAIAQGAETMPAGDECEDPTFKPMGVRWDAKAIPVGWRLDFSSIPDYLKTDRTRSAIRSAHRIWPRSQTTCSNRDENELRYSYLGHTARNPKYDRVNILDFGDLGAALAQNYTWYRDTEIVEVDLRLNKAFMWTNLAGVDRYHVRNVTAHELGHQVGLDDLGEPHRGLTMYASIARGETTKTTLGFGDLKGAWAVSP